MNQQTITITLNTTTMKTLSNYKTAYKKAAKQSTKHRIFNNAMLNLSYSDSQRFVKWQVQEMNK